MFSIDWIDWVFITIFLLATGGSIYLQYLDSIAKKLGRPKNHIKYLRFTLTAIPLLVAVAFVIKQAIDSKEQKETEEKHFTKNLEKLDSIKRSLDKTAEKLVAQTMNAEKFFYESNKQNLDNLAKTEKVIRELKIAADKITGISHVVEGTRYPLDRFRFQIQLNYDVHQHAFKSIVDYYQQKGRNLFNSNWPGYPDTTFQTQIKTIDPELYSTLINLHVYVSLRSQIKKLSKTDVAEFEPIERWARPIRSSFILQDGMLYIQSEFEMKIIGESKKYSSLKDLLGTTVHVYFSKDSPPDFAQRDTIKFVPVGVFFYFGGSREKELFLRVDKYKIIAPRIKEETAMYFDIKITQRDYDKMMGLIE